MILHPGGAKAVFVVIHEAMKVSCGGQLWVDSRGPQEIQCDFRLL
jgi:hypothetical protein